MPSAAQEIAQEADANMEAQGGWSRTCRRFFFHVMASLA